MTWLFSRRSRTKGLAAHTAALAVLALPLGCLDTQDDRAFDEDDRADSWAYVVHVAHVRSGELDAPLVYPLPTKPGEPKTRNPAKEVWATGITCINVSDHPTRVRVRWPGDIAEDRTPVGKPIGPGESFLAFSEHADGYGGASIDSDQRVRCTVNVHTETAATAQGPFATYEAMEASMEVLIVQALNIDGWEGDAMVFNPTGSDVTISYDGPNNKDVTIPAGESYDLELTKPFNGSVKVSVTKGGGVVAATLWRDLTDVAQSFSAMSGMTAADGARTVHVPRVSVNDQGRVSGVTIQNAGAVTTDVTVRVWLPEDSSCEPGCRTSCSMKEYVFTAADVDDLGTLAPGEGALLFLPREFEGHELSPGTYGSMVVESSSSDVVVTVNENVREDTVDPDDPTETLTPYGASYAAVAAPSEDVFFPQLANLADHSLPYVSEIQIANASAEAGKCIILAGAQATPVRLAPHGVFYARATSLTEGRYNAEATVHCTVPVTGVALMKAKGDLSATQGIVGAPLVLDGANYEHRQALLDILACEYPYPFDGDGIWEGEPNRGIWLQTQWQRTSNRTEYQWWSEVNYTLNVWQALSLAQADRFGEFTHLHGTLDDVPVEPDLSVDAALTDDIIRGWLTYYDRLAQYGQSPPSDTAAAAKELQTLLWNAHLLSIHAGLVAAAPDLAGLPTAEERIFAESWGETMVEYLTVANFPTNEGPVDIFSKRFLPVDILNWFDYQVPHFMGMGQESLAVRTTLIFMKKLHQAEKLVELITGQEKPLLEVWKLGAQVARDNGQDELIYLLLRETLEGYDGAASALEQMKDIASCAFGLRPATDPLCIVG